MSRTRWIIGNWKQHMLRAEAANWLAELAAAPELAQLATRQDIRLAIAPPFTAVEALRQAYAGLVDAKRGALAWTLDVMGQDVAAQDGGAFTGEVGPSMLRDCGATGALVGHSERRAHFGEGSALLWEKLRCARESGLRVVLCVGETLEQREAGDAASVVVSQLREALVGQAPPVTHAEGLLVAYEPVWAIGTGRVATPQDAQQMHARIRAELAALLGPRGADRSLLYGGSVKGENAASLLSQPDVDGLLIGGASLQAGAYLDIIRAALGIPHIGSPQA